MTTYYAIPETTRDWRVAEIQKNRTRYVEGSYASADRTVRFWCSNDAPVPMSFYRENHMAAPSGQEEAEREHTRRAIASYVAHRQTHGISDEERFEMRAAFGPGERVTDIFTGQTLIT